MKLKRRFPHRTFYRLVREFCKRDEAQYTLRRFLREIERQGKLKQSSPR